jgi:hypothetical protein
MPRSRALAFALLGIVGCDTANTITVRESAEKNEMCMAVGYFFPATSDTFCLDSTIYSF